MIENHTQAEETKKFVYECLELFAPAKIGEYIQDLLDLKVTELLGKVKGQRKGNPDEEAG